jgi:ubiquinone/menaquinone biosynthesis C-methylase UbiE
MSSTAGNGYSEPYVNGARPPHNRRPASWCRVATSCRGHYREEVNAMTVGHHFESVAPIYESLRTTDQATVQKIRELLPDRRVIGVDVGCGTGRYSKPLSTLLPEGSLLLASDLSAGMLAELRGSNGHTGLAPVRSTAEELPIRDGSLDLVTSFNAVHHFDLDRFLATVARVLRPGGQMFVYTRTQEQNARTVWGRWFPGFTEHEQRLYSEASLRSAVTRTPGLELAGTHSFHYARSSTPERLRAQAEGHHYSTFSLYSPDELSRAIDSFMAQLPNGEVDWVDEYLLVVAHRDG